MKKLFSFAVALIMLLLLVPFGASAEVKMPLWLTHYNDGSAEGAGSVFTETDTAGAWWMHVAFEPVKGTKDAFRIVEISDGSSGAAVSIEVPENGFVYAVNVGNDWPKLFAENGATGDGATGLWYDDAAHAAMPNYRSEQVQSMWNDLSTWSIGDEYVITGLDLEGLTVPTSTPDKNWYEPDYVCTAEYFVYDGSNATPAEAPGTESKPEDPASSLPEESDASAPAESAPAEQSGSGSTVGSENSDEASAPAAEPAKDNTVLWIVIAAAAVAVIAAVCVILGKKKKK